MSKKDGLVLLLAGIAGTLFVLPLMLMSLLYYSYVLSILWGWFMVPTFGLPAINLGQAYGITLIIGLLQQSRNAYKKEKPSVVKSRALAELLKPMVLLSVGYIVKTFLM